LCADDEFLITSNGDYTLPNDTIPSPIGDGIYSAQMAWLVYGAPPIGDDPATDPGYLGLIIPSEDIADINNPSSPIVDGLGCGTYYLVPVTLDDGIGANGNVVGPNDNGSVTWDKNGNGCFDLGEPIAITYACEIEADIVVNCAGDYINGIDFNISGGAGDYTVVNIGAGDLVSSDVPNGGTATVENLFNGANYQIQVTDEEGCVSVFTGVFAAPVINPIVITPALTCPLGDPGNVDVTIVDGTGNGAPYALSLNGSVTPGTNADLSDIAGTAVLIIAVDSEGCISDSVVTITSAGHFIDIDIITTSNVTCFGAANGSAEIFANPENEFGVDEGDVVSITWTSPGGATFPGDETNVIKTGMGPGTWFVTVLDTEGCEVTIPVTITSPALLDLSVANANEPTCYGFTDASIDLNVTGGTPEYSFSWKDYPGITTDVLNTIGKGTYWGYVVDANGCEDSIQIVINEPDSIHADFVVKDVDCFGDSTGSIYVEDVYNNVGGPYYQWDLGSIPSPGAASPIAGGLPKGTYIITIQDDNGCSQQYEFTLTEQPEIILATDSDPAYCRVFDYQNGNGVLEATATGGTPSFSYEWEELSTGNTSMFSTWGGRNPGDYKITVTDANGCVKSQIVRLDSLNPIANFEITSPQFTSNYMGTADIEAHFTNTSENYDNPNSPSGEPTFIWSLDYDNVATILSHDINDEYDTVYTAKGDSYDVQVCLVTINKNGCKDSLCKIINVFEPIKLEPVNIFTPNGDGINDLFTFEYYAKSISEFNCVITNRWGVQVGEINNVLAGWDGTDMNGSACKDGVYFYTYTATADDGTAIEGQGTVTINASEIK
jgi:gliding motility-associated-like protein